MPSWVKTAISAARALGALEARAGMGSRVAPQVMAQARQSVGAATTPASLRSAVLNAGDDARLARRTQEFASQPQPMAARGRSNEVIRLEQSDPRRMFDFRGPITEKVDGMFLSSPEKREMLFGGGATLHDPQGLMQAPTLKVSPTGATPMADTVPGRRAPVAAETPSSLEGTVAGRKPRRKIASSMASEYSFIPYAQGTGTLGATQGRTEDNPEDTARTGFMLIDNKASRVADSSVSPSDKLAAYKLHYKTKFRGLPVSIENRTGSYRYWYDTAAGEEGKTLMKYPYGYINKTKGLDGDHVDVFLGPNEDAPDVYVVMTNKAPDFDKPDEEKCFLGFDSEEDVRKAFKQHYDKDGFFRSISKVPFEVFKARLVETYEGTRKKVGAALSRELEPLFAPHGGPVADLQSPLGVVEKPIGFPPSGPMRMNITGGAPQPERIDQQFDYFDKDTNSTAVEGAWGSPSEGPIT